MTLRAAFETTAGDLLVSVELAVSAGEVVALLGPSGAGKTTTLLSLAGIRPIRSGRITLDEEIWADAEAGIAVPPERRRLGVVFQENRLFQHRSVEENIAFGPRTQRRRDTESITRVWMERLGVGHLAARSPSELSGGEARRVAIARTLASQPRAVAFDEPTASLDVASRQEVRSVIGRQLGEMAVPSLIVTHDHIDAAILADRIVVLEAGRITQQGSLAEVTARPRTSWIAELAGTNLWSGTATGRVVELAEGASLVVAESISGPVLVSVSPRAVTLSRHRPSGSARNVFVGRVTSLDPIGDRVRVTVRGKVTVIAEVTMQAVESLHLASDAPIHASAKATELTVYRS